MDGVLAVDSGTESDVQPATSCLRWQGKVMGQRNFRTVPAEAIAEDARLTAPIPPTQRREKRGNRRRQQAVQERALRQKDLVTRSRRAVR